MWSYGDSNSGPLACHTHSGRRRAWPGVALCGVHLRLPWPGVAWRRLASGHLGSPLGSRSSLAPLIFEASFTRPRRDSRQRRARTAEGPALAGNSADRAARRPRSDEANADPGSRGQRPQAAGTGNEDVLTASGQASRRPWRVIEIRQNGGCTNRHDPLPSSPVPLTGDRSCRCEGG